MTYQKNLFVVFLGTLLNSVTAQAASSGVQQEIHTGITFPSLHRAFSNNAAAIAFEKVVAVHGAYGPPILDASTHFGRATGTAAFDRVGISLGLEKYSSGGSQFGTGGAFRLGDFAFGAGMTTPMGDGGFDPNIHIGTLYRFSGGLQFAAILGNVNDSDDMNLGVGLGFFSAGKYNFELNFVTPPFQHLSGAGSSYRIGAGLAFYSGNFGLGFSAGLTRSQATTTSTSSTDFEVTTTYRFTNSVTGSVIYTYSGGSYLLAALTLAF